jgi:coenzyme PQQ precursor peptide PqqA
MGRMLVGFGAAAAGLGHPHAAGCLQFMKIMSAHSMNSRCRFALPWPESNPYRQAGCRHTPQQQHRRHTMKWEKPAASDMRFGFEINLYIANR